MMNLLPPALQLEVYGLLGWEDRQSFLATTPAIRVLLRKCSATEFVRPPRYAAFPNLRTVQLLLTGQQLSRLFGAWAFVTFVLAEDAAAVVEVSHEGAQLLWDSNGNVIPSELRLRNVHSLSFKLRNTKECRDAALLTTSSEGVLGLQYTSTNAGTLALRISSFSAKNVAAHGTVVDALDTPALEVLTLCSTQRRLPDLSRLPIAILGLQCPKLQTIPTPIPTLIHVNITAPQARWELTGMPLLLSVRVDIGQVVLHRPFPSGTGSFQCNAACSCPLLFEFVAESLQLFDCVVMVPREEQWLSLAQARGDICYSSCRDVLIYQRPA